MQIDFRSSEGSSLGVEVELEIVDLESRELRSGASEVLPLLGRDHPNGEHPKARPLRGPEIDLHRTSLCLLLLPG